MNNGVIVCNAGPLIALSLVGNLDVYHGDQPWPYGQSLHAILSLPAELAPYVPEFRYELCDLAGLADADIKGAVLPRVALLVMKHIADSRLAEQLPEIFGLLRTLAEKPTALGYLETLLCYLAAAATRLTEPDIQQALAEILPTLEEKLMPTIAETWLERGRAEGRAEGRVEGRAEGWLEAREARPDPPIRETFRPFAAPLSGAYCRRRL